MYVNYTVLESHINQIGNTDIFLLWMAVFMSFIAQIGVSHAAVSQLVEVLLL